MVSRRSGLLTGATLLLLLVSRRPVLSGYNQSPWQQDYPPSTRWAESGRGGGPPSSWDADPSQPEGESLSRAARIRMGEGRYKLEGKGADLICDFPDSVKILSNFVWERADLSPDKSLDDLYRKLGEVQEYTVYLRSKGSTLRLKRVTPHDMGTYRCIVTAQQPTTSKMVTLFQDVNFYPPQLRLEEDHNHSHDHNHDHNHDHKHGHDHSHGSEEGGHYKCRRTRYSYGDD